MALFFFKNPKRSTYNILTIAIMRDFYKSSAVNHFWSPDNLLPQEEQRIPRPLEATIPLPSFVFLGS